MRSTAFLSAVLALSLPAGAWSQEVTPLTQTVVTGSRRPERLGDSTVATEVISRAELVTTGARDLGELLEGRPGLSLSRGFAGTGLELQGLSSQYVLILVDGQRLTGRTSGVLDLTRLSVRNIEQVEITKGAGSVLYGSDAVAGVVNIITRKGQQDFGLEGRGSYGSFQQVNAEALAEARTSTATFRLDGTYSQRDAFQIGTPDLATDGSAFDGYTTGGRATWQPVEWLGLDGSVTYLSRLRQGVDASASGAVFDRYNQTQTLDATFAPTLLLSPQSTLAITAHHSRYQDRYVLDQRGSSALDQVQVAEDVLSEANAQWVQRLGERHVLTSGVDTLFESFESPRLETGKGRRHRLSAYAEYAWRLLEQPRLEVLPGLRVDRGSNFNWVPTPRLAARVMPWSWLNLRASFGFGYRAPSFQELFLLFENPSVGYVVNGNPDLRPERSQSLNLSAELRPYAATLLYLNGFHNQLRDMVVAILGSDEVGLTRYTYANLARVRVQGLELGAKQQLTRSLTAELSYTFVDGQDLEGERRLQNQARHRASAQLTFRFRPWGLMLWSRASVAGPVVYYEDSAEGALTLTRPTSVIWDARAVKEIVTGMRAFVGFTNLLNAGNVAPLPLAPRSVQGGLEADFDVLWRHFHEKPSA